MYLASGDWKSSINPQELCWKKKKKKKQKRKEKETEIIRTLKLAFFSLGLKTNKKRSLPNESFQINRWYV